MKRFLIALALGTLSLSLVIDSAEAAKRFGGGRSLGSQRESVTQRQATPPAASPQQQQAAPSSTAPAQAAPAQRPGMGRWLAPLAGLAAGLGLAALFGSNLGSLLSGLLVMVAVIAGVVLLMRLFARNRAQPAAQTAAPGAPAWTAATPSAPAVSSNNQFGRETVAAPPPSQLPSAQLSPSSPNYKAQFEPRIPAGFNVDAFLLQAKKSFVALQSANDRADLSQIREMTTPEMYEALEHEVEANRIASGVSQQVVQQVDVVTLNAELLEVVTEGAMHWASIRFSGAMREDENGVPSPFIEVWNLQKPVNGDSGWLLAGIQQVA